MNYFDKFTAQDNKLAELLAENHLLHTFETSTYPITLKVQPNTTPDSQMALFETSEDGVSSQDARLVFQFPVGGICWRVHGRLIIDDALLNKIKNHGKKLRDLWLQADFAARIEQAKSSGKSQGNVQPFPVDPAVQESDDVFQEFLEDETDGADEDDEE